MQICRSFDAANVTSEASEKVKRDAFVKHQLLVDVAGSGHQANRWRSNRSRSNATWRRRRCLVQQSLIHTPASVRIDVGETTPYSTAFYSIGVL